MPKLAVSTRACVVRGVLLTWGMMSMLPLQAAVFSADAVKAAFLYRFASYVEWPEDAPTGPLVIAVSGADEVATQLGDLLPRVNVNGRAVAVRRVSKPAELDGVHILYVGPDALARTRALRSAALNRPILIVTATSASRFRCWLRIARGSRSIRRCCRSRRASSAAHKHGRIVQILTCAAIARRVV